MNKIYLYKSRVEFIRHSFSFVHIVLATVSSVLKYYYTWANR